MTNTIAGHPKPMEHFMEAAVRGMGFVLVKDGTQFVPGRDQDKSPTYYVRVYQLKLDGRPQALRARFIYDIRDNKASCEFRPSIGECMNAIAHMAIAEDTKIEEVNDW